VQVVMTAAAAADATIAAAVQHAARDAVVEGEGRGAVGAAYAVDGGGGGGSSSSSSSTTTTTALQELLALADLLPSPLSSSAASSANMDDLD
jgi:hypothetical protein